MPIHKNSMSELAVYTFLRMFSANIDYSTNQITYVIILITNSTNKIKNCLILQCSKCEAEGLYSPEHWGQDTE